jgi:protein-S-isoprenylcysteine O-methyltransferase Ste14
MTPTDKVLLKDSFLGLLKLIAGLGIMLFLPGWSLQFWQGWVYLGLFTSLCLYITIYLWKNDRDLLQRRVHAGSAAETERTQKIIQFFAGIAFLTVIGFPALDHRFGWSVVPVYIVFIGYLMVTAGFFFIFRVFRENTFTAATIEVENKQKVISTGPYAVVRHPMYAGALVLLFGTPLALGSWWGLFTVIPITVIIIIRLLNEERFLLKNLEGYEAYYRKVKYRLVRFLW